MSSATGLPPLPHEATYLPCGFFQQFTFIESCRSGRTVNLNQELDLNRTFP